MVREIVLKKAMDGFCWISSMIFESTSRTHLASTWSNDCPINITNHKIVMILNDGQAVRSRRRRRWRENNLVDYVQHFIAQKEDVHSSTKQKTCTDRLFISSILNRQCSWTVTSIVPLCWPVFRNWSWLEHVSHPHYRSDSLFGRRTASIRRCRLPDMT